MTSILLKSKRLLLRTVRLSDARTVFAYRSRPEIYKYQAEPWTLRHTTDVIRATAALKPDTPDTWYQLAIIQKQGNLILGDIGIHFKTDRQAELGYTLAPEHQGQGYATEAVVCVLDYLFVKLKKYRVTASVDPKNLKSVKLLERIGMRREACFKKSFWTGKGWADDAVYAVLKSEWPVMKRHMMAKVSPDKT